MPRSPRLTRRELTVAGAGVAAAAFVPDAWGARLLTSTPKVGPGLFADGVASGEPAPRAMTFWSRMRTERARSGAELIVATDEGLSRVVARTIVPTTRGVDGSLKARIDALEPDTVYFFQWRSTDGSSDLGRTKTAKPADSQEPVRMAFSSCQRWSEGFFNGHADAARRDPMDLYLFLGDYTYEYENERAVRDDLEASVDLRSYRDKLALYRSDAGLRELHRTQPVAHIWDDHEVADNYSDNAPRPSDLQRSAAYAASFEWLPRLSFGGERYRIYRPYALGAQCEVFMLDQRQYRTGNGDGQPRQLLGRAQMDWLKAGLKASTARWKVIANQVMFVPLGVAGVVDVNTDQWDGYPAEQEELRAWIASESISDVVFVTGDIHTYFSCQVLRNGNLGPAIATEYVGGSISSSGLPALAGLTTPAIQAANPWIRYANGSDHGYATLDLAADAAQITYRVGALDVEGAPQRDLQVLRQPTGLNDFEVVGGSASSVALRDAGRGSAGGQDELPALPGPRELRSSAAPTAALARRRRKGERLAARRADRLEARRRARRRPRASR